MWVSVKKPEGLSLTDSLHIIWFTSALGDVNVIVMSIISLT